MEFAGVVFGGILSVVLVLLICMTRATAQGPDDAPPPAESAGPSTDVALPAGPTPPTPKEGPAPQQPGPGPAGMVTNQDLYAWDRWALQK